MVQVVVLSTNGESRSMKTVAFAAGEATGDLVAKALRKKKAAEIIGTYTYKDQTLTVWGWQEGKAGTENKHELPPLPNGNESALLFGDLMVTAPTDFTAEKWATFYEEAFGGFEDIAGSDSESEEEEFEEEGAEEVIAEDEDAEEDDEEEDAEEDDAAEDDAAVEEEEVEDVDDDCYDDGDENGGGGKRRAPRRRAIASPEYRRIDMGLRSRVKLPAPLGKRAPKWQTAEELETEEYD
jgi:hypothetical protein